MMGYKPTWDACLICHKSLGTDGGYFQPQSGGLLCSGCGTTGGGLVIGGETLEILYWLQGCELSEAGSLDPAVSQKKEIRRMFDQYFKTHIEHMKSLRSLEMYYRMTEG
jgi:recombinational DNA repair protein (RecF pathway)